MLPMYGFRICQQGIAALWLTLSLCLPSSATSAESIQSLADGEYIFASRLPDRSKHPDIQLAGAEIFVFQKRNNTVIGEHFFANSSDMNCFRGKLVGNMLMGEGLEIPYPEEHSEPLRFSFSTNLAKFQVVTVADIPYAKSSIQRCSEQLKQY